jgi:hypothetical protein
MRAPPFHGDNAVTIFAKAMKAELRESHRSARIFSLSPKRSAIPLCASARDGFESEERCAAASRRQPRLAEHGTSILLMARPTGVIRLLAATA